MNLRFNRIASFFSFLILFCFFPNVFGMTPVEYCEDWYRKYDPQNVEGWQTCEDKGNQTLVGREAGTVGAYCSTRNLSPQACMSYMEMGSSSNPVTPKCFDCYGYDPNSISKIQSCISANGNVPASLVGFKAPAGSSCSSAPKEEPAKEAKPPQAEEPPPPPAQSGEPETKCLQKVKEMLAKCEQVDEPAAGEKCSPDVLKKNKDFNNSIDLASTVAKMGGQAMAGMQDPCSKMSQAMNGAGSALGFFKKTCKEARVVCSDSCQNIIDELDESQGCSKPGEDARGNATIMDIRDKAKESIGACSDGGTYGQNENQAGQQAMELMSSAATMANCAQLTKGFNPKMGNSFSPECSGPGAATNPMCAGVGYMGGGSGSGGIPGGFRGNSGNNGLLANPNAAAGGGSDFGPSGPGIDPTDPRAGLSGGGSSGKGSGSMGNGMSADGSDENGGGGGAAAGYDMYGGFRSGGGLGGGSRKGGAGGDPAALAAAAAAAGGNPDLRKFLPGGPNDPARRGLAGVTGPDGITGPHSDLWQKVKNRYQATSDSLLP